MLKGRPSKVTTLAPRAARSVITRVTSARSRNTVTESTSELGSSGNADTTVPGASCDGDTSISIPSTSSRSKDSFICSFACLRKSAPAVARAGTTSRVMHRALAHEIRTFRTDMISPLVWLDT